MGYSTTYKMTWSPLGDEHATIPRCKHAVRTGHKFCPECGQSTKGQDVDEAIRIWITHAKTSDGDKFYGIEPDGSTSESCKWYDWAAEVGELSKVFPHVLFKLEGEGEGSSDIWRAYFRAGKVQKVKAKIIFDEVDFSKMTDPKVL